MPPIRMAGKTPTELMTEIARNRPTAEYTAQRIQELRDSVRLNEERFGIVACDVHAAINDGRLDETFTVTKWIMDIHLLELLERNVQNRSSSAVRDAILEEWDHHKPAMEYLKDK